MRPALATIALLAVAACGGGGGLADGGAVFPDAPLVTVQSDQGALTVALRSDPQPPSRGLDTMRLTITDGSGAPVDGLTLAVQPWMPDMGHGSATTPTVTARGGGIYDVAQVYLAMPGTWQLRTTITGSQSDSATPSFQVP